MLKFEKILIPYFRPDEIIEIDRLLSGTNDTQLISSSDSNKEIADSVNEFSISQPQIDLLITFAQNKLSNNKLVQFFLILGETVKNSGEYLAAISIFNYLLNIDSENGKLASIKINSYLAIADIYEKQAYWKESIVFIKKARTDFEALGDYKGIARCENLLGTMFGEQGEIRKAKAHFEKSLSLLIPSKDKALIGMLEINLGILNNMQGNFDEAFTYFQRALVKFEQTQDVNKIAELRHNLGMLFTQKGEYDSALTEFDKSISISVQFGFLNKLGISYLSKAFIYTQLKDYSLASSFADKAMEICYNLNDRLSIADIYKIKGIIERNLSNFKLAENYLLTSLRINRELNNALNRAETLFELGNLYIDMGQKNKALENFLASMEYFQNINLTGMIKKLKEAILQIK